MNFRIGALTISQSPRHDLLEPLRVMFPEHDIIEAGALDEMDRQVLPDGTYASYPLTTTLINGERVTLDRDFLAPLVQDALTRLEAQNINIAVLLCAGDFPDLRGNISVIQPTYMAQNILHGMGIKRLAVISPIAIQIPPIERKWTQAEFEPLVWMMPPNRTLEQQSIWINSQLETHSEVACVVLDYVGYPTKSILSLQKLVDKPIFDLGYLALSTVSTLI